MSNDAVNDLLLLCLCNAINTTSLVQLSLATTFAFMAVEHLVYSHGFVAARILVLRPVRLDRHLVFGRCLVEATVSHLRYRVVLHATVTFNKM